MRKYLLLFILYLFVFLISIISNNAIISTTKEYMYPTNYTDISSNYGNRILYGSHNFHNGIDFLAPEGSEIYATNSGYVEYASFLESGYGNTIIIAHDSNIKSLYCHTSENYIVKVGDFVNKGEVIGYVGPKYLSNGILNGNTTGPHLHFSIFENETTIDPFTLLKK